MRTIDVHKIIDEAKFRYFHWNVLFWCAVIIVFDGYDLVIYGVVLPKLMEVWQLTPVQAGALGSWALWGMMFGAFTLGTLADRIGRKWCIIICILLFSGFTVLTGYARNPDEFAIARFLAGLGIGGVMPNVVALMTEYAPKKMRSLLVAIMFSGYAVGGMLSAFLGMSIIPAYGWQPLFWIAGLPLLALPIIIWLLPESIGYLLKLGKDAEVGAKLAKIQPSYTPQPGDNFSMPTGAGKEVPLSSVFREGRALSTLMFWVAFFMCLLMVYAIGSWLPKLMQKAGYELGSSLSFLLVLNFGAIFGAIGGAYIADRFKLKWVLAIFFAIAALSISALGIKAPMIQLYVTVAFAGATTIGSQILLYAIVAQYYPMAFRSTGLGWASGVGRTGAILGPVIGGYLMAMTLPTEYYFYAFAIPGVIAALAISLVGRGAKHAPEEEKDLAFAAESGLMEVD